MKFPVLSYWKFVQWFSHCFVHMYGQGDFNMCTAEMWTCLKKLVMFAYWKNKRPSKRSWHANTDFTNYMVVPKADSFIWNRPRVCLHKTWVVDTQQYNLEHQNLQILKVMVIKLIEDVDLLLAKLKITCYVCCINVTVYNTVDACQ
jgi:hypothetical protein